MNKSLVIVAAFVVASSATAKTASRLPAPEGNENDMQSATQSNAENSGNARVTAGAMPPAP